MAGSLGISAMKGFQETFHGYGSVTARNRKLDEIITGPLGFSFVISFDDVLERVGIGTTFFYFHFGSF